MLLENLKGAALQQISSKAWSDEQTTKSIASQALPLILAQLEKNTSTEQGAEKVNEALNAHLWESKIDLADGAKILGHIFGDSDKAINAIAKNTGSSEKESSGVMSALSSVLMETLGDQKKAAGGFSTSDLMKLLAWTGKDSNILEMVMDQDGDGDVDINDWVKFGMGFLKKMLTKKK